MNNLKFVLVLAVLAAFLLSACSSNQPADNRSDNLVVGNEENSGKPAPANTSGNSDQESTDTTAEDSDDQAGRLDEDPEDSGTVESAESPKPAWYQYEFTDAATKETFTINGFIGKVVLVETLMFQCMECLGHQQAIKEMITLLGERDDFVAISINISPEEDLFWAEGWVEHYEFNWLYGDAPAEVVLEISGSLGRDFLNPSAMPIVIFDKEGVPHILPLGTKSAETLLAFVEDLLK